MKNIFTRFLRFTAIILLVLSFTALPLRAYEGQFSAVNDRYGIRSSVNAGFRLTIPFGPTKRSEDRVKYGLQLSLHREFNEGAGWNNYGRVALRQSFNAEIMSLNFSENGFKSLSLVGQPMFVYKNGVLMAVEDAEGDGQEEEKGSNTGWYIAGGVVLLAGLSAIAAKQAVDGIGNSVVEIINNLGNGSGG